MHVRWPRRQPGPPRSPGLVTMAAVGLVAFASAFGVARAAGSEDPAGSPASIKARPLALRTATALPAMKGEPGPSQAELEARREKARERARKRRLAKKREEQKTAEEQVAREERRRLRAERRAQRAAERAAEAERKLAAERRRQARERSGQPVDDSG
jgi:hypothetical protein